jgi:hypothetical protein
MSEYETVNKKYPVTRDGKLLVDEMDGFIVEGNIYVSRVRENGSPDGGLIGSKLPDPDEDGMVQKSALTTTVLSRIDFLRALYFTPQDLREMADLMESTITCKVNPDDDHDWNPKSVNPGDRHLNRYIRQIVREEYTRQIDFGMLPSPQDYAVAIEAWLQRGETPL